jgi:hypothetical protein
MIVGRGPVAAPWVDRADVPDYKPAPAFAQGMPR